MRLRGFAFPFCQQRIEAVFAGAYKNQTKKYNAHFEGMCGSAKPAASA